MRHILRYSCFQASQVKPMVRFALRTAGGRAAIAAGARSCPDASAGRCDGSEISGWPSQGNQRVGGLGDYNNDGRQDLLMIGDPMGGSDYVLRIYQNTPSGFIDQSSLIPSIVPPSTLKGIRNGAVAWGDYDHDGWLDFMLTGQTHVSYGVSILYSNFTNTGQGFFPHLIRDTRDHTLPENLPQVDFSTVNWVDYDSDGWLDLMITGSTDIGPAGPNPYIKLYHNVKGQNRFDDITDAQLPNRFPVAYGAVAWGDYDNDRKPDLLLTGQSNSQVVSKLYHNTGSGFEDASAQVPNLPGLFNGTADWVDFDKDGKLDLMLTGDTGSGYTTKFYHNTGSQYNQGTGFVDDNVLPESLKLMLPKVAQSATAWGDHDKDGYPDLLITGKQESGDAVSILFHNQSLGAGDTDSTRLRLVAPVYNCQSGAFTFQTTGGDGSGSPAAPIEYMAPGITAWTTNPHQFVDEGLR